MPAKNICQLAGCLIVTTLSIANFEGLPLWQLMFLCIAWVGLIEYLGGSHNTTSEPQLEATNVHTSNGLIADAALDAADPSHGGFLWVAVKLVVALCCWVSSFLMIAFAVFIFVGRAGPITVEPFETFFWKICLLYAVGVVLAQLGKRLTEGRLVLWIAFLPLLTLPFIVFVFFAEGLPVKGILSVIMVTPPAIIWAFALKRPSRSRSATSASFKLERTPTQSAGHGRLKGLLDSVDRDLSHVIRVISNRGLSMLVANGFQLPASLTGACEQSESGELVLTPLATSRLKVGIFVLAGLLCLWSLWPAGESSRAAAERVTQAYSAAVEQVMREETQVRSTAKGSATDVVAQMRSIDTSRCPEDFRVDFLSYIHAWESGAVVAQRNAAFQTESNGLASMAESVVRGYFGDPFGKALEIHAGTAALQQQTAAAQDEIRLARQKVEAVALKYGVSSP